MRCMREELSNLTSAQIVETSVTNNNSPGDFTQPTNKFHQAKGSQNILERRKLRERFSIFTMNKAIAAVLVIAIVAGVFVLDGNALLRAGRDRIEKFKQAMEHQREAPAAKRETQICWPAPDSSTENNKMFEERK
ncbi:uncharacterized protein LOC141866436 [Acropora palmata]|uniref:uncharacterized protein LOC141866436 n=1 Tax=Acropora palmata TaxID=6131 RepID=UPI003DA03AFD